MHAECAEAYIDNIGPACSICAGAIAAMRLQRAPPTTADDRALAKRQQRLRRTRNRAWRATFLLWVDRLWPSVAATLRHRQPSTARSLFLCMAMPDYEEAFVQRHMDRGRSRGEADEMLADLQALASEFEFLSRKTRDSFYHSLVIGFRRARARSDECDLEHLQYLATAVD